MAIPMAKRIPSWTLAAAEEIGGNVSLWRRMYGLTQVELAEKAKVSRETISRLENGDGAVSINTLLNVMHVFGILDKVSDSTNPYDTPFGMARAEAGIAKRISRRRPS